VKLVNESGWNTADLRKLLYAMAGGVSLRGWTVTVGSRRVKELRVSWSRMWVVHRIAIHLPTPAALLPDSAIDALARVEVGAPRELDDMRLTRLAGLIGKALRRAQTDDASVFTPIVPSGLRLRVKVAAPAKAKCTGVAYQQKQLAGARRLLVGWERRRRRAEAGVRKLTREIRRRERIIGGSE
jgi:hypothetical protein